MARESHQAFFRDIAKGAGLGICLFGIFFGFTQGINERVQAGERSNRELLQATALRAISEGKESSFSPSKEFSQETFDRLVRGTFQIKIWGVYVSGEKQGQPYTAGGTAWLADVQDGTSYLVTSGHIINPRLYTANDSFRIDKITLVRPTLDEKPIECRLPTARIVEGKDMGIIACDIPEAPATAPYQIQPFLEGSPPLYEPMMVLGFPFIELPEKRTFPVAIETTLSEIFPPDLQRGRYEQLYYGAGIGSKGMSGAALIDAKGTVVGLFTAVSLDEHTHEPINGLAMTGLGTLREYLYQFQASHPKNKVARE